MKRVPECEWQWFGLAGHYICAADCLFHMTTVIGNYVISTVGDLRPRDKDGGRSNRQEIGCGRTYETFAFQAGELCTCGCNMPMISGMEIDATPANDPAEARAAHMEMCLKYACIAAGELK